MVTDEIIIDDTLANVHTEKIAGCLCHAYCHRGTCSFVFNGNEYRFTAGDCLIVRRSDQIINVVESADFEVDVVYVTPGFVEICTPQSNYGMRGQMALFQNPIMRLTAQQQEVCALDFDYIKRRLAQSSHNFHRDAMINAIQCMIIDFFDFHVELYGDAKVTSQNATLMESFLEMLERGDFRKNREVGYYADNLCVTSKHLSEMCKKVSGFPASYWINRYTALDISRSLRDRSKSIAELADFYNFSSTSYLNRYVQKYLGQPPMYFRE